MAGAPAADASSPPCVSSLQAAATPEQIDRLRATAAASGVDIERMAAEWGATVETLNAAQAVALENRIRSDARREHDPCTAMTQPADFVKPTPARPREAG